MDKYIYEGRTLEEAINNACENLKVTPENIIYNIIEEKNSLLKKTVKIEVIIINEIIDYIKDLIVVITSYMDLKVNLEVRRRDDNILIKIFSNNNGILIGKNGKTISALQNVIKQIIYTRTTHNLHIILDVENYKENRSKNIEYLAKKLAREVAQTKVEVKMDCMNSYERRIVHSALAENKYVYTESIGEEPNRCVVIKPKDV